MMGKIPRCKDADCEATAFVVKRMIEDRLPTPVRNGLVAVPLTFATPTNYLATADKLMAGVRAKQVAAVAAVEQGDGEDETAAVGRVGGAGRGGKGGRGGRGGARGGGNSGGGSGGSTRPKDICPTHHRFKDKAWKCSEPARCVTRSLQNHRNDNEPRHHNQMF